jgi:hypothetical protein
MNKGQARKMKNIKKILMGGQGYIRVGKHSFSRMNKRGYTKGDLVSCIMNGEIHEVQRGFNHSLGKMALTYIITGKDTSQNPAVVILSEEGEQQYSVVTVMPPTDRTRFRDCIN